jgi:hypothetical protein
MLFKTDRRKFIKKSALTLTTCAGGIPLLNRQVCHAQTINDVKPSDIQNFTAQIKGIVSRPGSRDYFSAGKLWTGSMPNQPGLVIQCTDTQDIVASVNFAREQGLELAVRGGGHSDNATCEGGLLVNTSLMRKIQVDPENRRAKIESGVLTGKLDQSTARFGLAAVLGECSSVGISGLTLGGGLGRLMGQHGALCDTVVGAEVVTADGTVRQVNSDNHSDLFWAIRGGSGNFGIVTSFDYRIFPVTQTLAGSLRYPLSEARSVLKFFGEFMKNAPDTLDALIEIGSGILQYTSNTEDPAVVINVSCCGDMEEAKKTLRPLRSFGAPESDSIKPISYLEAQQSSNLKDLLTHIQGDFTGYRRSGFVEQISDNVIDIILKHCENPPFPAWSIAFDHYMHGKVCRTPDDECAFNLRVPGFSFRAAAFQAGSVPRQSVTQWVRRITDSLEPYSGDRIYLNYVTDQGEAGVRAAFGNHYQKLVTLKRKYDPTNLFHLNPNIPPQS